MKNRNFTFLCYFISLHFVPVLASAQQARLEIVNGSDKYVGNYNPALSSRLLLKGSRGEVLNFQVKIPAGDCKTLALSSLTNQADEAKIEFPLKLFKMETIRTAQPSFPGAYVGDHFDPLIPLKSTDTICSDAKKLTWIWGELAIPKETPPGRIHRKTNVR